MLKLIRDAVPGPTSRTANKSADSFLNTPVNDATTTSKSAPPPPRPQPKSTSQSHPYLNPNQTPPPPQLSNLQVHQKPSQFTMLPQTVTCFRPQRPTQSPPAPPTNHQHQSFLQHNQTLLHSANVSPNPSSSESPLELSGGEGSDISATMSTLEDSAKHRLLSGRSDASRLLLQLNPTKTNPEMLSDKIILCSKKTAIDTNHAFPIQQLTHSPQTPRRLSQQTSAQFFETKKQPCLEDNRSIDQVDAVHLIRSTQNKVEKRSDEFVKSQNEVKENADQINYTPNCPVGHPENDSSKLQCGLPVKFVFALRKLFDVFDDRKCGLVHLEELGRRFDSCSAEQPPELLRCLQQIANGKQDVDFKQFCAGVRTCLLRSQTMTPASHSPATSRNKDFPDMSLVTEEGTFFGPESTLNNEKQTMFSIQPPKVGRHRSNGNTSFDSTQSGQSSLLSQQLGFQKLGLPAPPPFAANRSMPISNHFSTSNPLAYRTISSPLPTAPASGLSVSSDFAVNHTFEPSSSVELRQPFMIKHSKSVSANFPTPPDDPLTRLTLCPSMERLTANVRQLAKHRPASVPVDQRRSAGVQVLNNVAIHNHLNRTHPHFSDNVGAVEIAMSTTVPGQEQQTQQPLYQQSHMLLPPTYAELPGRRMGRSSDDLLEEQRRSQILNRLNDWRDGVMRRGRSVEGRLEQATSQLHNFESKPVNLQNRLPPQMSGTMSSTTLPLPAMNVSAEPLYSVIDKRVPHRRREARRHTMTNAFELQTV